jgi:hypothetical protein
VVIIIFPPLPSYIYHTQGIGHVHPEYESLVANIIIHLVLCETPWLISIAARLDYLLESTYEDSWTIHNYKCLQIRG